MAWDTWPEMHVQLHYVLLPFTSISINHCEHFTLIWMNHGDQQLQCKPYSGNTHMWRYFQHQAELCSKDEWRLHSFVSKKDWLASRNKRRFRSPGLASVRYIWDITVVFFLAKTPVSAELHGRQYPCEAAAVSNVVSIYSKKQHESSNLLMPLMRATFVEKVRWDWRSHIPPCALCLKRIVQGAKQAEANWSVRGLLQS